MYAKKVKEFTLACNGDLPKYPSVMNQEEKSFIIKMIEDELKELKQAETITEEADALMDIIYYILNSSAKKGLNL